MGAKATLRKVFTQKDVASFAALSGDCNPIHLDPEYAKITIFKQPVVHGMLVSSMFSAVLAQKLPGMGSIYLEQELKFVKPVYLDAEVAATVEVVNIKPSNRRAKIVDFRTYCMVGEEVVVDGKAVVYVPNRV